MTEKLFYSAPYLREFDGMVQSCREEKGGYAVTLNRTAFYPEGGGQPCDLGTLDGVTVLDVRERDGEIRHLCAQALEEGKAAHGVIDWERRFDLMQQHSGEHLVSGLIHAAYGFQNVGFHMGKDVITIDFNGEIDETGLREIERKANEAVYADLQTEVFYPSREELEGLPYRSKKALEGAIRLVRFPGVDLCACCGTHVARTGEIGLIKLLSCVKFREGVRLELLCGGRCLRYLSAVLEQNHRISGLLSAKPLETAEAAARLQAELEAAKLRISQLEEESFQKKAEALSGQGNVLLFEPAMAPDSVRRLCDRVLRVCGGRCAVFAGDDEAGYKYALGSETEDLRPLGKEMNAVLQGRGGGKPGFIQGSVTAARREIAAFFAEK